MHIEIRSGDRVFTYIGQLLTPIKNAILVVLVGASMFWFGHGAGVEAERAKIIRVAQPMSTEPFTTPLNEMQAYSVDDAVTIPAVDYLGVLVGSSEAPPFMFGIGDREIFRVETCGDITLLGTHSEASEAFWNGVEAWGYERADARLTACERDRELYKSMYLDTLRTSRSGSAFSAFGPTSMRSGGGAR